MIKDVDRDCLNMGGENDMEHDLGPTSAMIDQSREPKNGLVAGTQFGVRLEL